MIRNIENSNRKKQQKEILQTKSQKKKKILHLKD